MNDDVKCFKCGIVKGTEIKTRWGISKSVMVKHHTSYNPEIIVDCCGSCHQKIHRNVRENSSCPYTIKETARLSRNSFHKRVIKRIFFSETLMPNIRFMEEIDYNTNNGSVAYSAGFRSHNKNRIYMEDI